MKKVCYCLSALILFSIFSLSSPVAAIGQYVEIGMQVSGSDIIEETFVTDIDWDDVHANPNTKYTWNLNEYYPGPNYYVVDLGTHTATIENISVAVKGGPVIELGFSAVSDNGPANFQFVSDVLTFDTLTDAEAWIYATADSAPGTTVSAVDFPDKLCRTLYNGTEIFADVIDPFSFIPGGVYEYITSTPIAGEVSSMQIIWSLGVNSGGHANGICTFDLDGTAIPEPATVLVLGLGGLALLRKRRI